MRIPANSISSRASLIYNYFFDTYGRCKWSTNTVELILFVKYDMRYLNILDVEKKTLALKDPIQMDLGK